MPRDVTALRFSEQEKQIITAYAQREGISFSQAVRKGAMTLALGPRPDAMRLADVAMAQPEDDVNMLFSQFLDDFKQAHNKEALIADEPVWMFSDPGRWYFDLAATAHKLAHDNDLPVPRWALDGGYIAPEPFFAFNTENEEFRDYLRTSTPREFISHNLFLGENILSRM
ncbi:MAG: hypothetical protein FWF91_08605 [Coriobacteriia bacterium]|nr:hypothetical protein [Coriobacteriia bacterium]